MIMKKESISSDLIHIHSDNIRIGWFLDFRPFEPVINHELTNVKDSIVVEFFIYGVDDIKIFLK